MRVPEFLPVSLVHESDKAFRFSPRLVAEVLRDRQFLHDWLQLDLQSFQVKVLGNPQEELHVLVSVS